MYNGIAKICRCNAVGVDRYCKHLRFLENSPTNVNVFVAWNYLRDVPYQGLLTMIDAATNMYSVRI